MADDDEVHLTVARFALDFLCSPFVYRLRLGKYTVEIAQESFLSKILAPIPLGALLLGAALMIGEQSRKGTGAHLLLEIGSLLIVVSLLLIIASREARQRMKNGEDAAYRFRRTARIVLGLLGSVVVVAAFWTPSQYFANLMVTAGVAIIAAAALDTLIVAPAERLYRFMLGSDAWVVTVGPSGEESYGRSGKSTTLFGFAGLQFSVLANSTVEHSK